MTDRWFGTLCCLLVCLCLCLAGPLEAATFAVADPTEFQNALTAAQVNGEDDTINVAAGTYNVTVTLTYTTTEDHSLTLVGAGAETTVLDGGNAVPVLRLDGEGDGDIHISGLTLQHGRNGEDHGFGGGLLVNNGAGGSTTVDHCVVTQSQAAWNAAGACWGP